MPAAKSSRASKRPVAAAGTSADSSDERYLSLLIKPIRVCAGYKPKLGQGADKGLTLEEFRTLYQADPFYSWFGLDNPMMYAAHKAAGGMTSVYRQIGHGVERVFREILRDQLGVTAEQSTWSYEIEKPGGKKRKLKLDGRFDFANVQDAAKRRGVEEWVRAAAEELGVAPAIQKTLKGAVFEVRQGYKSKDSKRQNGDIANAAHAYTQAYLPCCVVMSMQIDSDIVVRYRNEKWAILTGALRGSPQQSTYVFTRDVLGYDLAGFFKRNSATLRAEIDTVLNAILSVN